jgi:putative effector of murein hydrolase
LTAGGSKRDPTWSFVVVPANVVLAIVLMDREERPQEHSSSLMVTGQAGLFVAASILFIGATAFGYLCGKIGE